MPNTLEDRLRPHLSALIDGELEPLEAIAVQRHVRSHPELGAEQRSLEQLKLAVHLAGTRDQPNPALKTRLLAVVRAEAEARRARRQPWRWLVPLAGIAVAAAVLLLARSGDSGPVPSAATLAATPPPASAPPASDGPAFDLRETALARLIEVHRGRLSPLAVRDLSLAGILITLENLPDGFIGPTAGRQQIVQASYSDCNPRPGGATLAVLQADRVDLPPGVDAALEGTGGYTDVIDGVDVRLSTSGDKLFVLFSDAPTVSVSPI